MTPEKKQETIELIVQKIIVAIEGSWNFTIDEGMKEDIYRFLNKLNVDQNIEVHFFKYIDKYDDLLLVETEDFMVRIVYARRKIDKQMVIGININRKPESKFSVFCRSRGIPNEIIDNVIKKVNLKKIVLICVCNKMGKFEEIKESEGEPVSVIEGDIVSIPTNDKGDKFSFYVIENDVVIYLPIRKKNITWYNYEP